MSPKPFATVGANIDRQIELAKAVRTSRRTGEAIEEVADELANLVLRLHAEHRQWRQSSTGEGPPFVATPLFVDPADIVGYLRRRAEWYRAMSETEALGGAARRAAEARHCAYIDAADEIDRGEYLTAVRYGDSSYDLDHRGSWGASSVPGVVNGTVRRFPSRDVARDLLEQAREMAATGGEP